jgi:hypothetical protein
MTEDKLEMEEEDEYNEEKIGKTEIMTEKMRTENVKQRRGRRWRITKSIRKTKRRRQLMK